MPKEYSMDRMGLLNICKSPGMSSHEVVSRIRRLAGMKRVGHTGTLDPAACGVLLVCLGPATRLAEYIDAGSKAYRAEFTFGVTSNTEDAEGDMSSQVDASHIGEEDITSVLPHFTGVIEQRPPAHSAIQIGGQRAYHLARRGAEVELPLRTVTIHALTLARFQPGPYPRALVDITCSKGTYIRSLARDLGKALGVGATMSFLARTRVSDCTLEQAITLDELTIATAAERLDEHIQRADAPLVHIPAITLSLRDAHYTQGATAQIDIAPGLYRVYLDERFLGLGRSEAGVLRAVVNLQ